MGAFWHVGHPQDLYGSSFPSYFQGWGLPHLKFKGSSGLPYLSYTAAVQYLLQWNPFLQQGWIFLGRLGSVMGRGFCGHSFLQCPASPHLKQIPSVFTAATNAWATDVTWYATAPISLVATIQLSWCSSRRASKSGFRGHTFSYDGFKKAVSGCGVGNFSF